MSELSEHLTKKYGPFKLANKSLVWKPAATIALPIIGKPTPGGSASAFLVSFQRVPRMGLSDVSRIALYPASSMSISKMSKSREKWDLTFSHSDELLVYGSISQNIGLNGVIDSAFPCLDDFLKTNTSKRADAHGYVMISCSPRCCQFAIRVCSFVDSSCKASVWCTSRTGIRYDILGDMQRGNLIWYYLSHQMAWQWYNIYGVVPRA